MQTLHSSAYMRHWGDTDFISLNSFKYTKGAIYVDIHL